MNNQKSKFTFDRFIYPFVNIVRLIRARVVLLHQTLLQTTRKTLDEADDSNRNTYQLFSQWLFETLMYGVIITFIYITSFNKSVTMVGFFILTIMFGLLRWLVLDTLNEIMKIVKG